MRKSRDACSVLLGLAVLIACEPELRPREVRSRHAAPAVDPRGACADVLDFRVCWDGQCPAGACVTERALPALPSPSPLGFRCAGSGAERTCIDRARAAGPFECEGTRCTQLHPRLPSDGEWTCAEMAGAAICVGGDGPAGVPDAGLEPDFSCGKRRRLAKAARADAAPGASGLGEGDIVCVDLSPDFPDSSPRGWRCRYEHEPGVRRICERGETQGALGAACRALSPCMDGLLCAAGRCVPRRPEIGCWLDGDCASGVCRLGSCVVEGP